MKLVNTITKIKHFKNTLRPSQSLHTRFFKSSPKEQNNILENANS